MALDIVGRLRQLTPHGLYLEHENPKGEDTGQYLLDAFDATPLGTRYAFRFAGWDDQWHIGEARTWWWDDSLAEIVIEDVWDDRFRVGGVYDGDQRARLAAWWAEVRARERAAHWDVVRRTWLALGESDWMPPPVTEYQVRFDHWLEQGAATWQNVGVLGWQEGERFQLCYWGKTAAESTASDQILGLQTNGIADDVIWRELRRSPSLYEGQRTQPYWVPGPHLYGALERAARIARDKRRSYDPLFEALRPAGEQEGY